MSIVDKVIAAVTPPESDEARAEAREKARAAARPGSWLELALDHHLLIEDLVADVRSASAPAARLSAFKELALVLNAHSLAEEIVIYPALALSAEKAHAEMGFNEQALVKIQMAALEHMDPMSQEFVDKLEHIHGALQHHMYEEENTWFMELLEKNDEGMQTQLTGRFVEEFRRYAGGPGAVASALPPTVLGRRSTKPSVVWTVA